MNYMSENLTIANNTPMYGVINLLTYINKDSKLRNLSWYIGENQYSGYIFAFSEDLPYSLIGNDEPVYRFFTLPYSGIEFSEYDFESVDFNDLHKEDQDCYLSFLDIIGTDDSQDLANKLTYELEESEQA